MGLPAKIAACGALTLRILRYFCELSKGGIPGNTAQISQAYGYRNRLHLRLRILLGTTA